MLNAFKNIFKHHKGPVCIIGSDCYELTSEIIEKAVLLLKEYELVVGPSLDGGYYLLGMQKMHTDLFKNINWSTSTVFDETLEVAKKNRLKTVLLPYLQDVDTEEDLVTMKGSIL